MMDPMNRVNPDEVLPSKADLADLEKLQAEKERAEDRLLDRLETAAAARALSAKQNSIAHQQTRRVPPPPVRRTAPRGGRR